MQTHGYLCSIIDFCVFLDHKFSKLLLLVDTSLNVHIFPKNEKALYITKARSKSIFVHIAEQTQLKGYVVNAESEQLRLEEVWTVQLSPSEHIIDQIGKNSIWFFISIWSSCGYTCLGQSVMI